MPSNHKYLLIFFTFVSWSVMPIWASPSLIYKLVLYSTTLSAASFFALTKLQNKILNVRSRRENITIELILNMLCSFLRPRTLINKNIIAIAMAEIPMPTTTLPTVYSANSNIQAIKVIFLPPFGFLTRKF